jgi:hypothetical protein
MVKHRKPNRGARALPKTLSAPTGGLNGRDALGEQAPNDAFRLENWIPNNTSVDTRGGSVNFATGMPGAVESVEVYTGGVGGKMLAFSAGNIYNVTLGGAVGAAIASGKTSNKITSAMFSNAGSQFLLIYSGADQPLSYDGTTLTGLTITGLTGSQNTLHSPLAFKGRMYLAQAGQLGFYYLAVGAIQGAASFFDLQQQCLRGGSLATITSFSQDSGNGPADYCLFVTTEGEYVVYAGTDPSNATTWVLVGRYYGPPPIGKKGWFKYRSDVYFITEEGVLSFSEIREGAQDEHDTEYLTSKLGKLFKDAVTAYQGTHGWCGIMYPRGAAIYLNVPMTSATNGRYVQFVMNTKTKDAWTEFTGWNAICWALFNRRAYFGTFDGRVVLADEGFTDNGAAITCTCRQSWNTFDDENGMGEADKQFHFVTFAMSADGSPSVSCELNVNYEDDEPQFTTALTPPAGAEWDLADWDTADWAGSASTQNITVPVGKFGYIASIWMRAVSTASTIKWFASRIVLEKTRGVLLQ